LYWCHFFSASIGEWCEVDTRKPKKKNKTSTFLLKGKIIRNVGHISAGTGGYLNQSRTYGMVALDGYSKVMAFIPFPATLTVEESEAIEQ
jgi:hypothetical protein